MTGRVSWWGDGEDDALARAMDCPDEAVAGRIADGQAIPRAFKAARGERLIPLPAPGAAKAALQLAMTDAGLKSSDATSEGHGRCSIRATPRS